MVFDNEIFINVYDVKLMHLEKLGIYKYIHLLFTKLS